MPADGHVIRVELPLADILAGGMLRRFEIALGPGRRIVQHERVFLFIHALDDAAAVAAEDVVAEVVVRLVALVEGVGMRVVRVGIDAELLELPPHREGQVVVFCLLHVVRHAGARDKAGHVHELAGDGVVLPGGVEVREAEALLLHLIQRRGNVLAYRVGREALGGYHNEVVALEKPGVFVLHRGRAVFEILVRLAELGVLFGGD